jgi:hypothetical protein
MFVSPRENIRTINRQSGRLLVNAVSFPISLTTLRANGLMLTSVIIMSYLEMD